jgi:NAD(P)-dependent dehydrogenase (short-subunit alcohol dehydrogenase family)
MSLTGNVALVTGGTGGLGSAVVAALLAAGATVDVPYYNPDGLERLRQHAKIDQGAMLSGGVVDLTEDSAVAAYCQRVVTQHGGIDILVNVAGGFGGGTPVHETDWAVWQQQLDINLKTAVLVSSRVVPAMQARGGGSIVNVGTRTATQKGAKLAAYAASKRALMQLTEAMAAELRDQFITVNTVLPSVIDTPTNRQFSPNADYSKWVRPDEIARVILFLVGNDARIVSGAHIPVYGRA